MVGEVLRGEEGMTDTKEGPFTVHTEGTPDKGKVVITKTALVRLVGLPYQYLKHFEPVECISPGMDRETGKVLCPLMLRGFAPKLRLAIWTFDRLDNNELKVMDFVGRGHEEPDDPDACDCEEHRRTPVSDRRLYDWFSYYKLDEGVDPSGPKGPDFNIKIVVNQYYRKSDGVMYKMSRRDTAVPTESKPFTEQEIALIKSKGSGDGLRKELAAARRDNTPEEIMAMLSKKEAEQGWPKKRA